MEQNPVMELVKQLIDKLFHRDCGESIECRRLKSINEHYSKIPVKHVKAVGSLSSHQNLGADKRLIAYTKFGGAANTPDMQMKDINEYCASHGYQVCSIYNSTSDQPGLALHDAITELTNAAGLIVSDLSRLVEHHDDPLRELAPLMHQHFFHGNKTLISLKEGINTSTLPGQEALLEFLNELRDIENQTC